VLKVQEVQWNWSVPKGSELRRETGFPAWILAQYLTELEIEIDGTHYSVRPGDFLILEPDTPHSYYCPVELYHSWLHAEGDFPEMLQRYGIQPNHLYSMDDADRISDVFRQLAISYLGKERYLEEYMNLKLQELLILAAMENDAVEARSGLNPNVVQRLRELRQQMVANPEYDWSIAEMAKRMYMSESYFAPLYRKYFGITPNRDLTFIRIERGKRALARGSSVAAAAERCGYSNVYHFIRQFKKLVGVTPNRYKHERYGRIRRTDGDEAGTPDSGAPQK